MKNEICKYHLEMEKLRSLQSSTWELIDKKAYKNNGKSEVRIKGRIHPVNKAILEANGFYVNYVNIDYYTMESCYTVKW